MTGSKVEVVEIVVTGIGKRKPLNRRSRSFLGLGPSSGHSKETRTRTRRVDRVVPISGGQRTVEGLGGSFMSYLHTTIHYTVSLPKQPIFLRRCVDKNELNKLSNLPVRVNEMCHI